MSVSGGSQIQSLGAATAKAQRLHLDFSDSLLEISSCTSWRQLEGTLGGTNIKRITVTDSTDSGAQNSRDGFLRLVNDWFNLEKTGMYSTCPVFGVGRGLGENGKVTPIRFLHYL